MDLLQNDDSDKKEKETKYLKIQNLRNKIVFCLRSTLSQKCEKINTFEVRFPTFLRYFQQKQPL